VHLIAPRSLRCAGRLAWHTADDQAETHNGDRSKARCAQRKSSFIPTATIGFAQSGAAASSSVFLIFPRSMCSTRTGFGVLPSAGSASALLSYTRSAVSLGSR
jgi:hypothetical protein